MSIKNDLQQLIDAAKTKQFRDGEAKGLVQTIGSEIKTQLAPLFETLAKDLSGNVSDAVSSAIKGLKVDVPKSDAPQVHVNVPDVHVPEFNIPTPKVTVNVPKADAPVVNVPAPIVNMPGEMMLKPNSRPFPVMMVDAVGKPMQFPQASMGASGGRADFFTIVGMPASTAIVSVDSTGVAYSGSNPVPVTITSGAGATTATNIVDSTGVAYSGSNPVPVTASVAGITNSIQVVMLDRDGNPWQPDVFGPGEQANALRITQAGDSVSSVVVNSGTITTVTTLTGVTNSVAVVALDRDGNPLTTGPIGAGELATALRTTQAGDSVASVVVNSGTITTVTTLTGITNSVASSLVDSGGVQYSGSNPVPITGNIGTVTTLTTLTGVTNSVAVVALDRDGNPLTTGPIGAGELATALRTTQAGDSVSSVIVNSGTITTVTTLTGITNSVGVSLLDESGSPWQPFVFGAGELATSLRTTQAGDSVASVVVNSGTITTVTTLTGITNSVGTVLLDSGGVAYSGSNPVPTTASLSVAKDQGDAASAMRVVIAGNSDASVVVNSGTITTVTTLTGITNTIAAANVDSTGVQYSGSNPLPITVVSGALTSMIAVGDTLHDAADIGAAPVKVGGVAMQTNPTAVADGDRVNFRADDLGRQITRTTQARDLIMTAYVTLSTGTEATLLAASAGNYLDLISVIAANTSSAAQQLDIRAVTAGNVVQTLYIPANSTAGWTPAVPWPQDATGNNWTVDMADVTNSNIIISALFSKEA